MARKLDRKAFRQQLAEYIASLRQTIETECLDFDVDPVACAVRKRCTENPASGYDFFVSTYFPHYIRHASRSQLHDYLFERLSTRSVKRRYWLSRRTRKTTTYLCAVSTVSARKPARLAATASGSSLTVQPVRRQHDLHHLKTRGLCPLRRAFQ